MAWIIYVACGKMIYKVKLISSHNCIWKSKDNSKLCMFQDSVWDLGNTS
jgi:hypothetical protein